MTIFKILFGLIYTVGYFFLALLNTGGGHGNFYILLPLIPWLLLFVPILLFGKLDDLLRRIIFVLLMSVHYAILMLLSLDYDFGKDKGWNIHNFPYSAALWYLLGQLIIWAEFFYEVILKEKGKAG